MATKDQALFSSDGASEQKLRCGRPPPRGGEHSNREREALRTSALRDAGRAVYGRKPRADRVSWSLWIKCPVLLVKGGKTDRLEEREELWGALGRAVAGRGS